MIACAAILIALLLPEVLPIPADVPVRYFKLGSGSMDFETEYIDHGGEIKLTIYDGSRKVLMTVPDGTVDSALTFAGIELGEQDLISCDRSEELYTGLEITITRVETHRVTEYEAIPYETVTVENDKLPVGETNVKQTGAQGQIRKTYDIVTHNGNEYERTLIENVRESEPVEEVVEVGVYTEPVIDQEGQTITLWDGTVIDYAYRIDVTATAYSCEGQEWNITKTGTTARVGAIAVDPRYIPLNSKLYVVAPDGSWVYGFCRAEDTGGLIKGYRIDLYYDTIAECYTFGRRKACVYVLPDDYELPAEVMPASE
ncbi:MAG: G5 domain-containing protein [Clostridiaceae bacterium]|nr:G5 domain-containing protein [Clostridiaceae bacterium]